jgi:hypothetical protein
VPFSAQPLRYVGVGDSFANADATADAVEVVDASSGRVVHRRPIALKLPAGRRVRLRGEVLLAPLPRGRHDLRLSAK